MLIKKNGGRITQFILLQYFRLEMSSVHVMVDDDGITSVNETSPLIIRTQETAPLSPRSGPRHSICWVNYFHIKENK